MLRSLCHGFATLQAANGFRWSADIDESFEWLIAFADQGLRAVRKRCRADRFDAIGALACLVGYCDSPQPCHPQGCDSPACGQGVRLS